MGMEKSEERPDIFKQTKLRGLGRMRKIMISRRTSKVAEGMSSMWFHNLSLSFPAL